MIDNIQHNSKPCPIGKFSNQDDNLPVNKCTESPEGTSTSEVGQVSCDFCESGKYYSRDYLDRCLPCAKPVNNCLGGMSCGKNFEGFLSEKSDIIFCTNSSSPAPYTSGWLAIICSTKLVPDLGIPKIKIGEKFLYPQSLNFSNSFLSNDDFIISKFFWSCRIS